MPTCENKCWSPNSPISSLELISAQNIMQQQMKNSISQQKIVVLRGLMVNELDLNEYRRSNYRNQPHPLFDCSWYTFKYLGGDFSVDSFAHYLENEIGGQYDPNPYFRTLYYKENFQNNTGQSENSLQHYIEIGEARSARPNTLFDPDFYRQKYSDLASWGNTLLQHYIEHGRHEGRQTHILFDSLWYKDKYSDITTADIDALHHFIRFGIDERRNPHPLFDIEFIYSQLPTEEQNIAHIIDGFVQSDKFNDIDPHPAFESNFYARHTDGYDGEQHPLIHYLMTGSSYGSPNKFFSSKWYLEVYDDVQKEKKNPLLHYIAYGWKEGRNPSDAFNTNWYLRNNGDVEVSVIDPLSHYIRYGAKERRQPTPPHSEIYSAGEDLKFFLDKISKIKERSFLKSDQKICFPVTTSPDVSIILVLYNKSHLTLECLRSILINTDFEACNYEVIIYDNGSSDDTSRILDRIENVRIVKDNDNIGYLRAVNKSVSMSKAEAILLLNNDTYVMPRAVENAFRRLSSGNDIGAVGAKLILPSGYLQEAGSIIWSDGSCLGYLRNHEPECFEANYIRDVDYCSGAFLMLNRNDFIAAGGFDEIYVPAYYEETDFCAKLQERGQRIIYDPSIEVIHYEFGSSASAQQALELQGRNKVLFSTKHQDILKHKPKPSMDNILLARNLPYNAKKVLFIDDKVPHSSLGSGFPRARTMLNTLAALQVHVTLLPTNDEYHDWKSVRETLDPRIEVAFGFMRPNMGDFLKSRRHFYDLIAISRPHNMKRFADVCREGVLSPGNQIIWYDAEAVFNMREIAYANLRGFSIDNNSAGDSIHEEISLANLADVVTCVSDYELSLFENASKSLYRIGHALKPQPSPAEFEERADILFVGGLGDGDTPNTDSILWFIDNVFDLIKRELPACRLLLVGSLESKEIQRRLRADIISLGRVNNIDDMYNKSRIFIAPTRFAAGIPHKVHEAAAMGLPSVVTALLGKQLSWCDGNQVLIADSPQDFARACVRLYQDRILWQETRMNALKAIEVDCDEKHYGEALRNILNLVC